MSKNRKVMVIDDEYDIVYVLRKHLEKWGFTVDTFTNPLHAFEIFKQNPDRYSIILTDIRMPGRSGFELAKLIWALDPQARICFMSAFEILENEARKVFSSFKTFCFIKKPMSADALARHIESHFVAAR